MQSSGTGLKEKMIFVDKKNRHISSSVLALILTFASSIGKQGIMESKLSKTSEQKLINCTFIFSHNTITKNNDTYTDLEDMQIQALYL